MSGCLEGVNVKFEFAAKDNAGGGPAAKRYAGVRGYEQKKNLCPGCKFLSL